MGAAKASELLLFNKKISAAEAFNRNLVTQVIPDDVFAGETKAKIESIAKLPPQVGKGFISSDFSLADLPQGLGCKLWLG